MRLGGLGICDDCGKMQISGYLVPVLNHFMCQKCYDDFDNHSTYYSSDADVEKKVAKYYEHVILSDNDTDEDIIESYSKEQSEKGCYAMFEYHTGFRKTLYWSKRKMLAHANKYSMAFNADIYEKIQRGEIPEKDMWRYSSFWYKDFDAMAMKTMLRQLISKWGVMSIDMENVFSRDMSVINEDGSYDYVDNPEEQQPIIPQPDPDMPQLPPEASEEIGDFDQTEPPDDTEINFDEV